MEQSAEDENEVLLNLAGGLNSDLNGHQEGQLDGYAKVNDMMNFFGTGETLIVVGSCSDGSKVNTPFEKGDIDVLVVSGNVELSEQLFKYVPDYPAFLNIPIKGEHSKLFGNVESADNEFLSASVLHEMIKDKFIAIKFFMNSELLPEKQVGNVHLVGRSAVGFESKSVIRVPSGSDGGKKIGPMYHQRKRAYLVFLWLSRKF